MIYYSFLNFYPNYIKKEDVNDFVSRFRKTIGLVLLACSAVIGVMQFVVSPKLITLYTDFNKSVPIITQYSNQISIIIGLVFLIISILIIAIPPDYRKLDRKLMKYKTGEMIKTREVIEIKYIMSVMVLLGVVIGYLVIVNIVPIYSLTDSFK